MDHIDQLIQLGMTTDHASAICELLFTISEPDQYQNHYNQLIENINARNS